jgi:phospholipid transport system substrate-binding protein
MRSDNLRVGDPFPVSSTAGRRSMLEAAALVLGFALIAAALVIGGASVANGATGGDPMAMVKSTVTQVLGVLNDRQTPQDARSRRLIQLVAGRFDFSDMARSTLGYHWRDLKPGERQQFVPLFTAFMEDVYLNKLQGYSGQKIEFINETADRPGYSQVNTRVIQPNGGQPVRLAYRLRQDGNDWKVYDVTVNDISITANYRNQFNRVINDRGFDILVQELRSRQQQLAASLGNGTAGD